MARQWSIMTDMESRSSHSPGITRRLYGADKMIKIIIFTLFREFKLYTNTRSHRLN